ncbi:serine/threonine-protein kinase 33-like [Diprion similis]|uniref:serine/threonine-protein kinase 33-like n=1 Tax=Diprion similis TaxID=362088 RepID=UPI001EF99BE0|nr:serine/threonine-protein kinase 33-like [Diprion similis]
MLHHATTFRVNEIFRLNLQMGLVTRRTVERLDTIITVVKLSTPLRGKKIKLMFQKHSSTHSTKLKERDLIHKRITDLAELQRIYEFGEILGKGSFGTVVKASHKGTGINWAVKIINKSQAGASRIMLVEREIHILKLVNHPNIILLDRVFESPKAIYLIFELCTGSLAKTFKAKKRFEEKETLTVIRSLAGALSYLHKNDIVHRDLKLENILIAANPQNPDDDLHIKVTDFGLSAVRGGTGYETMLHDCCGTLTYMAPEMIATKSYSQQCDVWSMGIIMYVLLVGKFPFYSTNDQHLHLLVKTQELDFSGLPCSEGAKHLLSKMLQKNPAFRVTAAEVENHPWIAVSMNQYVNVYRNASKGNHSMLQAHSSNVLDMMRMWRTEMMRNSSQQKIAPQLRIVHRKRRIKEIQTRPKRVLKRSILRASFLPCTMSHLAWLQGEGLRE